ncbi:hypothetical protein B6254_1769 [Weissella cibaria]|uniref:MPN domain-containing protein n=3 Tax=Weissella cibaria TaxID=137591 RepID=A0A2S1KT33_9LACO|nr:hypothetical protein B6254_1769 [Weissella cibaria]
MDNYLICTSVLLDGGAQMLEIADSVQKVGDAMVQQFGQTPQEACWILAVNTQMRVLEVNRVAMGTLDSVTVHPRDIFRRLVALNAYGFIVVHNHPSGSLRLSQADRKLMTQLAMCSGVMQFHFLDFMVISSRGYTSLRSQHWLTEISVETLYDLWTKNDKV